MTTLLIDGDEYLFKACSVVEREVRWDEDNHVLYCNRLEAWDNFERMVGELREKLSADVVWLCFSGSRPYFREVLDPSYKGGRQGRKPLCYADLRLLCNERYTVRAFDTLEADDIMGILATSPANKGRCIIVSQDKDMKQIPGRLWREGEVHEVSKEDADKWFLFQALRGDPTDGYPGCPGLGDKRAEAHLVADTGIGLPYSWERVLAAYDKHGLDQDHALLQARLARILRWEDWNSKKKEVKLWSPTR